MILWWSGVGVGVGMLRGSGDTLTWKKNGFRLLGFLFLGVLAFGFLVSKFLGFKVSWLHSSKDSKIRLPNYNFMCSGRCWFRIQFVQEI